MPKPTQRNSGRQLVLSFPVEMPDQLEDAVRVA